MHRLPNILLSCLAVLFPLLSQCRALSETRKLPAQNPRAWTFHASHETVSICASSIRENLVADRWGAKVGDYTAVELIEHGHKKLHNVYLSNERTRGPTQKIHSEIYLLNSCPLPLYAEWHVKIMPETKNETRVEVKTWGQFVVHNYGCFYIGHPFGCGIPVDFSTIEEYRILRSIGDCVGERGMPEVITPSGPVPDPATCRDK